MTEQVLLELADLAVVPTVRLATRQLFSMDLTQPAVVAVAVATLAAILKEVLVDQVSCSSSIAFPYRFQQ